jgi:hypothetical protein
MQEAPHINFPFFLPSKNVCTTGQLIISNQTCTVKLISSLWCYWNCCEPAMTSAR